MRVLPDTNVLISATLTRGLTADLFRLLLTEHQVLIAEVVLEELLPILRDRFHIPEADVRETERDLRRLTVVPRPAQTSSVTLRDPADGWVLASAESASADLLVTGDKDLLDVASQAVIRIVSPRQAWELLRALPPE